MQRNRETKQELKLKALSSMFKGNIQNRRLMVTNPKKSKGYFLYYCIFGITKLIHEDLRGQSLAEYLTMKRINPEFD
jgi:hypothetical protein